MDKPGGFLGRDALVGRARGGRAGASACAAWCSTTRAPVCLGNEPVRVGGAPCGRVTSGGYGHRVGAQHRVRLPAGRRRRRRAGGGRRVRRAGSAPRWPASRSTTRRARGSSLKRRLASAMRTRYAGVGGTHPSCIAMPRSSRLTQCSATRPSPGDPDPVRLLRGERPPGGREHGAERPAARRGRRSGALWRPLSVRARRRGRARRRRGGRPARDRRRRPGQPAGGDPERRRGPEPAASGGPRTSRRVRASWS